MFAKKDYVCGMEFEKRLDHILICLNENFNNVEGLAEYEILNILDKDRNTELKTTISAIINKLEKDDYIYDVANKCYRLTIEGQYFILNGGYNNEKINKNKESIKISELELRQSQMEYRLFLINVAIAVGALIASVYYLSELCWKYHWFDFCGCDK